MKNLIRFFLFVLGVSMMFTNCQSDDEIDKTGTPFSIDFEFRKQVTADLSIAFEEVTEDSRCPCDALCIVAGEIGVKIKLETNETALTKLFTLEGYEGDTGGVVETEFEGYHIKLVDVLPFPCNGEPNMNSDYSIEVLVTDL